MSLKNDFKECMEALKNQTYLKTKAEDTVKVLKEIIDTKNVISDKLKVTKDEEMEVTDPVASLSDQLERNKITIPQSFTCETCKKIFLIELDLKDHQKSHIAESLEIKCNIYSRSFTLKDDLSDHEKIHNSQKCNFCGTYFESKTELTKHMSVHNQTDSDFHCEKCTKSYTSMGKLRRHDWRSHRKIDCNICGKTLQSREAISDHRKAEHRMFRKAKCLFFPNCIDEDECFFEHDINAVEKNEILKKPIFCPDGMNCKNQGCEYSEAKHSNRGVSFLVPNTKTQNHR